MAAKKKASGPSGAHTTTRRKITLGEEEQRVQDACAAMDGMTWAVWARAVLRSHSELRLTSHVAPRRRT